MKTGIGNSSAYMNTCFDVFRRLRNSTEHLTVYIFGKKHDIDYRQTGKCVLRWRLQGVLDVTSAFHEL